MPEMNVPKAGNVWLVSLAAINGGYMTKDEAEHAVSEFHSLLFPNDGPSMFQDYVWGYVTANGPMLNRASLAEVGSRCKTWPTFGKLCEELRKWIADHPPKKMIEAPKPSNYYDPRYDLLSVTEKSWHAYYVKREGEAFRPIGPSNGSTRLDGETEAQHKAKLRLHVLSLIRTNAPRVWAIIVSADLDQSEVDPASDEIKGGVMSLDHPLRAAERREVDNRLFGLWSARGELLEPGVHPATQSQQAYDAWMDEDRPGYVSLKARLRQAATTE